MSLWQIKFINYLERNYQKKNVSQIGKEDH